MSAAPYRRLTFRRRVLRWTGGAAIVAGVVPAVTYAAAEGYYQPLVDQLFRPRPARQHEASGPSVPVAPTTNSSPVAAVLPPWERDAVKWNEIAPTLRPGDLVLLMGTGTISHRITALSFLRTWWDIQALRYSHVGIVVPLPSTAKDTGSGLGVALLESIDNQDVKAKCLATGEVRFDTVQLTDVTARVQGREGDRWCYSRCAIRRLEGWDWKHKKSTLEVSWAAREQEKRRKALGSDASPGERTAASAGDKANEEALQRYVRRPLEKSFWAAPATIFPSLLSRKHPSDTVTCSELVVRYLLSMGIVRWAWHGVHTNRLKDGDYEFDDAPPDIAFDDGAKRTLALLQAAPFHFGEGFRIPHVVFNGPGVRYGPEIFVDMSSHVNVVAASTAAVPRPTSHV